MIQVKLIVISFEVIMIVSEVVEGGLEDHSIFVVIFNFLID